MASRYPILRQRGNLVLCAAPPLDPPFDDELPAGDEAIVGQLAFPLKTAPTPPVARVARSRLTEWSAESFAARPTSRAELPPLNATARRLGQVIIEAWCGTRPLQQLRGWLAEPVFEQLAGAVARPGAARRPLCRIRHLRVCEPDDGVAEVALVFVQPPRTFAAVMRLEGTDGRWLCTLFEII